MPYKDKNKQKEAQHNHYLKNKSKYFDSRVKNRDKRSIWFDDIKSKLFCGKCGFSDKRSLDFHHRNEIDKSFGISDAVKSAFSQERILEEISKCDVLCANCHVLHHFSNKEIYCKKAITNNCSWYRDYKSKLSCVDCKISNPIVLSFHHVKSKTDGVSSMLFQGCSIAKLIEEIEKCEVLCFNCHRIRHEGNVWKEASKLNY